MTSMRERERKRRPLHNSNPNSRYVWISSHSRGGAVIHNRQDNFNVRLFLRGELEKLPPMPNPIVVATEGKPRSNGVRR